MKEQILIFYQSTIKNLIVTTKCFDVSNALSSILAQIEPRANIILMTNGMGILEEVLSKIE